MFLVNSRSFFFEKRKSISKSNGNTSNEAYWRAKKDVSFLFCWEEEETEAAQAEGHSCNYIWLVKLPYLDSYHCFHSMLMASLSTLFPTIITRKKMRRKKSTRKKSHEFQVSRSKRDDVFIVSNIVWFLYDWNSN